MLRSLANSLSGANETGDHAGSSGGSKTQQHGKAAYDSAGVRNGDGIAEEAEIQEVEKHAASESFKTGFDDYEAEAEPAKAAGSWVA